MKRFGIVVFSALVWAFCLRVPAAEKFEPLRGAYLGVLLENGGTAAEVAELNAKAGKGHAVYAKFVVFRKDPFPWDWVNMIKTNCPGAGIHLILEPMVGFEDFFAPDWGPGQGTYEAARSFVTHCSHAGLPVFLRFAHEANGWWYPWAPSFSGTDSVSNDTYIAGWRNFADLVHSNAPNVAMVWAPNQGNGPGELPKYMNVYPGDEFVDWVGLSVYNGDWYGNGNDVSDFEFKRAIQRGYSQDDGDPGNDTAHDFYWEFSDPNNPTGHHKPMMIAETSAQFLPQFSVTSEVVIAGFESMSGPQFSPSSILAAFQDLNSDGLVMTGPTVVDSFENIAIWNWGPWGNLFWSNSAQCVDGTNAVRMGGSPSPGETYVGGNGHTYDPDWSMHNGMELWVKGDSSTNVYPILTVGLRSIEAGVTATATVTQVITSDSYYPLKILFSNMTASAGFSWSNIWEFTLELLSTEPGRRPKDVWVDQWTRGTLTNAPWRDQDWWPQGTNCLPWGDGLDTNGGTHAWALVADPLGGYPTQALRMSGSDRNTNYYIGGNGFSTRAEDRDWSGCTSMALLMRRSGNTGEPDPMLSISLLDGGARTATVSEVVTSSNYVTSLIKLADMTVQPGLQWTNISSVKFEMLTSSNGVAPSDVYVKQFSIGTFSNEFEQDWWTAGDPYAPWGHIEWTQTTEAAAGAYALRFSGTDPETNWYIGGNGCSLPVAQQNWTNSNALVFLAKRGTATNIDPELKFTLDNDYAETNGNEAWVKARVSNTNYSEITIAFEDFKVDPGFEWEHVRMLKLESFTSRGGMAPNDMYIDQLRRTAVTLTNGADNARWKGDWMKQLYSLRDGAGEHPAYADVFRTFRNLHMINWFHVRKFEDGMTKDFKILEDGGTPAYSSYYALVSNDYFLTNVVVDGNEDGIADAWQQQYFHTATNADASPASDPDGDGQNNWTEYVAGTDPATNTSAFLVGAIPCTNTAGGYVVQWNSAEGRVYSLDRATNLCAGFDTVATDLFATPPLNVHTDAAFGAGPCFYRIKVVP